MNQRIEKQACSPKARFRKGDLVVVRREAEIRATLDAEGTFEGIPFMPEMVKYCGRRLRVFRRADKVFLDYHLYLARLTGTVLLEAARCDGQAHGGCQMGCLLFWKEPWLRSASAEDEPEERNVSRDAEPGLVTAKDDKSLSENYQGGPCGQHGIEQPKGFRTGSQYVCQATALRAATSPLPWWYPRQYLRAMLTGEATPRQLAGVVVASGRRRWRRRTNGRHRQGMIRPQSLGLQAGDSVEVRGLAEIEATLDADGKHRGLLFTPEMAQYCGRRFQVLRRVEWMILEWTGEMRSLRDTVILDRVTCRGIVGGMCPRNCFHLWRESWLKRVP